MIYYIADCLRENMVSDHLINPFISRPTQMISLTQIVDYFKQELLVGIRIIK